MQRHDFSVLPDFARLIAIALLMGLIGGCRSAALLDAPATPSSATLSDQPTLFDPPAVYLTWQRDPTTTMTVHWHSMNPSSGDVVIYGKRGGELDQSATGTHRPLPYSRRTVHTVELTDLDPATDYSFKFGPESAQFSFRTMPATADEPITFVEGGDADVRPIIKEIYEHAARLDPMFAVLGGDIAYADGAPSKVERWHEFLDNWKRMMVTSDGRLIPLLVAIGNHEVAGGFQQTPAQSPYFYNLFAMPGPQGYNALDFGDYMSIILLDSDHTHPVAGDQTTWLQRALEARKDVPHLFAVYHVPAYPSHRPYSGRVSRLIRRHWSPLFEKHGVDVAFEHHDHTYKRTHRIRNGRVDPEGVLYLGDGAWGQAPRTVHSPADTWYLARAESLIHFIATTIHGSRRTHTAIDIDGRPFDEITVGEAPMDAVLETTDLHR